MTATANVTEVSVTYLRGLSTSLSDILSQVNAQLDGTGPASPSALLAPVNASLTVGAGGPVGDSQVFNAGAALNTALATMGGSVHDQLNWLSGVLSSMIGEVSAAITAVGKTEYLNDEQADALISEFQSTIGTHVTPS
jgi:hypothetical protein